MKILTKEEEREHYHATVKGGTIGGVAGLGLGFAAVYAASARYQFMRQLTLPLKAFLVTSAGTFAGIISADHYSRAYEAERNPLDREFKERERQREEAAIAGKSWTQRAMEFGKKERYKIAIVNRNKYLTGQQKLVQARVYAQFLTLGVLIASAAFEISDQRKEEGRWETVRYIDPKDPEHKRMLEKRVEKEPGSTSGGEKEDRGGTDLWKEMVDAEEQRLKEREEEEKRWRKHTEKKAKKNGEKKGKKEESGKSEDEEKEEKNEK